MNYLLTEIEWDAEPVVAQSLPTKILILDTPEKSCMGLAMQRFLKARFGYSAHAFTGDDANKRLPQLPWKRTNVVVTVWEDTP